MTEEERRQQNSEKHSENSGMGVTVSRERWIEMMNQADSLEQYARTRKRFAGDEPPTKALTIYRQGRTYYLLNLSWERPTRIELLAVRWDVNLHSTLEKEALEVTRLKPRSYMPVGEIDLEKGVRMVFYLLSAEWEGGENWKGKKGLRTHDLTDIPAGIDGLEPPSSR